MAAHVYVLAHKRFPRFKIGKAIDIATRSKALGADEFDFSRSAAVVLATEAEAFRLEQNLHQLFARWRVSPDHVLTDGGARDGYTEWFEAACRDRLDQYLETNLDLLEGRLLAGADFAPHRPLERARVGQPQEKVTRTTFGLPADEADAIPGMRQRAARAGYILDVSCLIRAALARLASAVDSEFQSLVAGFDRYERAKSGGRRQDTLRVSVSMPASDAAAIDALLLRAARTGNLLQASGIVRAALAFLRASAEQDFVEWVARAQQTRPGQRLGAGALSEVDAPEAFCSSM